MVYSAAMTTARSTLKFNFTQTCLLILSVLAFCFVSLRILIVHPLNWDEGWNLAPAVNLIQHGHYGVYLLGVPVPPVLSGTTALLTVCSLSVSIFGTGVWQPRLIFLLISCVGLFLLYLLSQRLHGRTIAILALSLATLLTPLNLTFGFHGPQIFGEVPMLTMLWGAALILIGGGAWRCIAAAILFSLAINFKVQLGPMLFLSSAFVGLLALIQHRYKAAFELASVGFMTYVLSTFINPSFFSGVIDLFVTVKPEAARVLPEDYAQRIIGLLTLNYDLRFALRTLGMFIDSAPFFIFAALFAVVQLSKQLRNSMPANLLSHDVSTLLNTLALIWTAWFLLLSVGYPRYLFPAVAMLTPSAACALESVIQSSLKWYKHNSKETSIPAILGFSALTLLICQVSWTIKTLMILFTLDWQPLSTIRVADKLNSIANGNIVVESVESELFPFLRSKYYFPSEYEIMQHAESFQSQVPLKPDLRPRMRGDIIVIGSFAKSYDWYPQDQWNGKYSPIFSDGEYKIIQKLPEKISR